MKTLIILALMLVCIPLSAAEILTSSATASWAPVTKRVDDTPLKPEEIKTYRLKYQKDAGIAQSLDFGGTLNTATIPNLVPGAYKFTLQVVDTGDISSNPSAPFTIVIPARPATPVLTIKFSCATGCSGEIVAP